MAVRAPPALRLRRECSLPAQSRFIVQWRVRFSSALWSAFAPHADLQPCNRWQVAYGPSTGEIFDLDESEPARPSRSAN